MGEGGGGGWHREGEGRGGGQGGEDVPEGGGVEGEGQGVAGHRETFLREQGHVCSSLCVALQKGGDICLVGGGGDLESVGHRCREETGAVSSEACGMWRKVTCR